METGCMPKWFRAVNAARMLIGAMLAGFVLTAWGAAVPPADNAAATFGQQAQAFVDGMKPLRQGKPVIAVLALNEGTEMTDFLLTHAVLRRSGVADVQAVAPRRGRVSLYPALDVEVAQDLAEFDRQHPSGADYVIVPAMQDDNNAAVTTWLRDQANKGARIVGVCAGGLVVGRAGLLDGRQFTTHWYFRKDIQERHPDAVYVPHQRYVVDRGVATTTGITASIPAMLALVEAIGGRGKAQGLASELGVSSWTPAHDSSRFGLNFVRGAHYLLNKAAFWRDQEWKVDVQDGMDDIALALVADAWSRTGHVRIDAASSSGPVRLRSGLRLLTKPVDGDLPRMPLAESLKPVPQLDRTLCEIGERYGVAQRDWVMMELEYPGMASECTP